MPQPFANRFFMALIRGVFVAAGLVFAGLLLASGLVLAVVLLAWGLLRGRRPAFRFQMKRNAQWAEGMRRGGKRPAMQEVVDVQAREIPEQNLKENPQNLPRGE